MTLEEFKNLIEASRKKQGKESMFYLGKIFISIMLFSIVSIILFEGEPEPVPLSYKIIGIALMIGMFTSILYFAKQSDTTQKMLRVKTPCCKKEIFSSDAKIIIAARGCPYCGAKIIVDTQQQPSSESPSSIRTG